MRKTLVLGAALLLAFGAFADFLYWQIPEGSGDFSTAALYAIKGDKTDQKLSDSDAASAIWLDERTANGVSMIGEGENKVPNGVGSAATGPFTTDISGYGSGYSFFVELLTYNSNTDSWGTNRLLAYSYDRLMDAGYIDAGAGLKPVAGGSTNFSMTHVPEPSSGLLMLLGGALMALRRRRRA